jgi:DNA repair exonuclease SbcCD ATPase subunit
MPTSKLDVIAEKLEIHANKRVVFTPNEAREEIKRIGNEMHARERQVTDLKAMPLKLKNAKYLEFEKMMETYNIRQRLGGDIEAHIKDSEEDIKRLGEAKGKFEEALKDLEQKMTPEQIAASKEVPKPPEKDLSVPKDK